MLILKIFKPVFLVKDNRWKLATIVVMSLMIIGGEIAFNYWNAYFYNAMSSKNIHNFKIAMLIFTILAFAMIITSVQRSYIMRKLIIKSRSILYEFYGTAVLNESICKVPCQRMSQDLQQLSTKALSLLISSISAVVMLPAFLFILLKIANFWMVLASLVYAALGTVFSKKLAKPIIKLDYDQESLEGNLRKQLVNEVKKETTADKTLPNLKPVIDNYLSLISKEKLLDYFTISYNQCNIIYPLILLFPFYWKDIITFGAMMQAYSAFEKVLSSISFFVNNREGIVELRATLIRVSELSNKS